MRTLNEDAVLADAPVYAVADGMGGHSAGEVASAIAINHLRTLVGRADLHPDDVIEAVTRASNAIAQHGAADEGAAGLGTTVSGVCMGNVGGSPHWFVFNVGDSRVYRLVNGDVMQVTTDHSEVAELVAAGLLSPADARSHPKRNIITRSLGGLPCPAIDMWVLPADPGDRFIVCSDGLSNEVDESEMRSVAAKFSDPQAAADELVRRALDAGAHDNVSVLVVELPPRKIETSEEDTVPRGHLAGAHDA